jgi:outer membrane protein TolC
MIFAKRFLGVQLFLAIAIANARNDSPAIFSPAHGRYSTFRNMKANSPNVVGSKWLLLDFGERKATTAAAREKLLMANVGFNGTHQKIVFDVTDRF